MAADAGLLNHLHSDGFDCCDDGRRGFLCRSAFGLSFGDYSLCRFSRLTKRKPQFK